MTLPSDISTAVTWPAFKNGFVGPFEFDEPELVVVQERGAATANVGDVAANTRRAQSFTPSVSFTSEAVYLLIAAVGSPADFAIVDLCADNGGVPGTVLATTHTNEGSTFAAQPRWANFSWDPAGPSGTTWYDLVAGTTYWLVLRRTVPLDATNYYRWYANAADVLAGGVPAAYNGTSWTTGTNDHCFKVRASDTRRVHYAVAMDAANSTLEVWRSYDGGHTWEEADPDRRKAVSTTAAFKTCAAKVYDDNIEIAYVPAGGTAVKTCGFDLYASGWREWELTTNLTGAASLSGAVPALAVGRSGDYVVCANKPTESVMGTAYRRIGLSYRALSTFGTVLDIISGTGSNPGTQVHYDLQAIVLGSGDRVHLVWTQSDSAQVKTRIFKSDHTFTTIINPASAVCNNANSYPIGLPCTYLDGADTWIAVPYVDGSAIKVLRAKSSIADIVGNWTTEAAASEAPNQSLSNPCVLMSDVKKLWLWFVTSADAERDIAYCHDQGVAQWTGRQLWKEGDTVKCGGLSAAKITDAVGVLYLDEEPTPARVRFDRLLVFQDKVGVSVGSATKTIDLGTDDPGPHDLVWDIGAGADPAGNIDILVESSPDGVAGWREEGRGGADASQSEGGIRLNAPMRHVRITAGVANFASTVGVTGV